MVHCFHLSKKTQEVYDSTFNAEFMVVLMIEEHISRDLINLMPTAAGAWPNAKVGNPMPTSRFWRVF